METKKFIYYQEEDMFVGWLEEYPDYRTQGESMEELEENLIDSYKDQGLVLENRFTVETLGGAVTCCVRNGGKTVTVEMGKVSFLSTKIPVTGEVREVLRERPDAGRLRR